MTAMVTWGLPSLTSRAVPWPACEPDRSIELLDSCGLLAVGQGKGFSMGRFVRRLLVRGVLLLGLASVLYYLGNGIFGTAPDRWYGEAMVYMIIAMNLITPVVLFATMSGPRVEQLARQERMLARMGQPELVEGVALSQEWTDDADPMSHPLYHSTVGIPVLVSRITDTRSSIRMHPVVRLRVRGETEGEFDVVAVVPRIAVPRVGDIVRVVAHPADPARYRYAGPVH